MGRNRRTYIYHIVFGTAAYFLIAGLALAVGPYQIKVDLDKSGDGTGEVSFSAISSPDFEFSGWTGEYCTGKFNCLLRDLFPKKFKTVIANFNAPLCTEFTYSEFGTCQVSGISGTRQRTVTSASPRECVGGNPETSRGCSVNVDPCAKERGHTIELPPPEPGFWGGLVNTVVSVGEKVVDIGSSAIKGNFKEVVNKTIELFTGNIEYADYVPPEGIGGGVPVEGGNYDVIGKGGQKVGTGGGGVVNVGGGGTAPAPTLSDSNQISTSAPAPKLAPESTSRPPESEIELPAIEPPITVTAPRDKSDFPNSDIDWGRNPCN